MLFSLLLFTQKKPKVLLCIESYACSHIGSYWTPNIYLASASIKSLQKTALHRKRNSYIPRAKLSEISCAGSGSKVYSMHSTDIFQLYIRLVIEFAQLFCLGSLYLSMTWNHYRWLAQNPSVGTCLTFVMSFHKKSLDQKSSCMQRYLLYMEGRFVYVIPSVNLVAD